MTVPRRHVELVINPRVNGVISNVPTIINPKALAVTQKQHYITFQIEKQVSSEPNSAYIDVYNIASKAGILDFRFDPNGIHFGAQVTVNAGYIGEGLTQLFTGVITNANTFKAPPNYITRMEIRNIYFELMKRRVKIKVDKGFPKYAAVLKCINQIGGDVSEESKVFIAQKLAGAVYEKPEVIEDTAENFLSRISATFPKRIVIYWDDAGVAFNPVGIANKTRPIKTVSIANGLIGTPQVLQTGYSFEKRVDGSFRINDRVIIQSETVQRAQLASGGATQFNIFQGPSNRANYTVVKKIIHSGDNRSGDFKTSMETVFIDEINRVSK